MRLVKSPASPTINQLGFRDVGKSGVAFSRRVSGCLFETRFSRKSGARLSASIKASRPPAPRRGDHLRRLDRQAGRQATARGPDLQAKGLRRGKLESRTPAFLPPDVT